MTPAEVAGDRLDRRLIDSLRKLNHYGDTMPANRNYKIAVLPGDGTGPEVVHEGLKSLQAAAAATGFSTR